MELMRDAERDRAELLALREEAAKLRAENRRAVRGEVRASPPVRHGAAVREWGGGGGVGWGGVGWGGVG